MTAASTEECDHPAIGALHTQRMGGKSQIIYLPRIKPTPAYRTQWQIRSESPLERHLQQRKVTTVSVATFQSSPLNAVSDSHQKLWLRTRDFTQSENNNHHNLATVTSQVTTYSPFTSPGVLLTLGRVAATVTKCYKRSR